MSPDASVTFVGTATTLLHLGEFTLLTDPNFLHAGEAAYLGYGLWSRRRTQPALDVDELPTVDAVVLSHLHGDHFDRVAKARLPRALPIVSTPSAAYRLERTWRFRDTVGLRPWSRIEFHKGDQTVRVTAVPGQHGPALVHLLMPETIGSVIDWEVGGERRLRLYVTGDTLCRPWLREIPQRLPGIDVMLAHLGGTKVLGVLLTMDGRQGADLVEMIRPSLTLPIHYDDYPVFRSPLSDFLSAVRRRGLDPLVRPLHRGETASLAPVPHSAQR
ncbi:MBL fold metallo-hydrolase [Planosporangium sp. 12N6]|uniref:MBL fold metallo-hydrolase n=1 Tax=Planosporangium spinosum TaxID=3402278 RepID=UPI003CE979E8